MLRSIYTTSPILDQEMINMGLIRARYNGGLTENDMSLIKRAYFFHFANKVNGIQLFDRYMTIHNFSLNTFDLSRWYNK